MQVKFTEEDKKAYRVGLSVLVIFVIIVLFLLIRGAKKKEKQEVTQETETPKTEEIQKFGTPTGPVEEKPEKTAEKPTKGQTYAVKVGDSLYSIGQKAKVDWKKIAEANNLTEPYNLTVGQILTIPKE